MGELAVRSRPAHLVLGVTLIVGIAATIVWGRPPDPWIVTHLAITYEVGLVPRALWGTVLDAVGLMPRAPAAAALATHGLAVAAIAIGASALLAPTIRGAWGRPRRRTIIVSTVLLSPAGFPFLAAEIGRLDAVLVALTILAALVARRRGRHVPHVVAAIVAIAVLVHEAAVLVTAPLAGACVAKRHGRSAGLVTFGLGLLPLPALVLRPMPLSQPEFSAWLATRIDRVDPFATLLPYQDLTSATGRAWRHLTAMTWQQWTRLAAAALPAVAVSVRGLPRRPATTAMGGTLVAAALAPLLLSVVGTDLTRWAALATLGLAGVAAALTQPDDDASTMDVALCILALAATTTLGPLAV